MSYRDDKQALEPHLDMILRGIEGFDVAVRERIKSKDWSKVHILKIQDLKKRLLDLEIELTNMKNNTW